MTIPAGTRLGPYEIVGPLGAGGMGEVYRALDTRLDRTVAIKVLPSESSASPEAAARFEREARAISRFSHPHICQLHDVGHENGTAFLVMELIDGETLAGRLAKGALPFDQVRQYGMQMAEALSAAHRAGIVHRDLKPGNVMLARSGVKLLDFGLAKGTQAASDAAVTPTIAPVTSRGAVAGTVAYMAPEVLEGQPADERSDVYALGAVLYEMATGHRYFTNATQPVMPAALNRIVRGCLARDPEERWQSARDVRLQLADLNETERAPAPARGTVWLPWAIVVVALASGAGMWFRARSVAPVAAVPMALAFDVPPPEGGAFVDSVETTNVALSPDGSQLAYIAEDATGQVRVWIRTLSASSARPLQRTEGARFVFWAPTGRTVGFATGDKLKRLDLPDGTPVTITDIPDVRIFATWGEQDIIYAILPGPMFRVPVAGGPSTPLIQPEPAKGEIGAAWPVFLPDGKRFLYLSRRTNGRRMIRLGEVGKPSHDIIEAASMAQVLDGKFLVYARENTLVAQRFDLQTGAVSGDPFPIAEPIRYFLPTGAATFSSSQAGVLVYQSHLERGRLVWLDRAGNETGSIGDDSGYGRVRIAPNGREVLFVRTDRIWKYDIDRKIEQPVISDESAVVNPVWIPNGSGVLYSGGVPPHLIRWDATTGAKREVEGMARLRFTMAEDISPDGETLLFTERTPRGSFDIWTAPLNDLSKRTVLRETPFDEASVRFSADGQYLAYASNELGPYEVFVVANGRPSSPIRVSTGGGWLPRWSRDGRELFFVSGDGWLVSLPVTTAPSFTMGAPRRLFAVKGGVLWADVKSNAGWPDYDVSPDGKRFLAVVPDPASRKPLTVLVNWRPPVH